MFRKKSKPKVKRHPLSDLWAEYCDACYYEEDSWRHHGRVDFFKTGQHRAKYCEDCGRVLTQAKLRHWDYDDLAGT